MNDVKSCERCGIAGRYWHRVGLWVDGHLIQDAILCIGCTSDAKDAVPAK